MSLFTVTTKLWPSGQSLDTGTDDNVVSVPPGSASFDRHAALYVTSPDGTENYEFLFWNTGRNITNKRHVHWDFSAGGWTTWNATRWYGMPNGGPGSHTVEVDPFSIAGNGLLMGETAIDPAASSFPPGAYPDMGNDHLIDTEDGAIDVAAKGTLDFLQFAGWDQLIWGGDDSGTFYESDTGPSQGSPGFYPVGSGTFHVAQGGGATLLALYGNNLAKFHKENLKSEVDVAKSFVADFPKLKDNEGDPWQRYTGDPAWAQVIRLIVERADQLQQQVTQLRSFIQMQERPKVGNAVIKQSQPARATRKRSRKKR